MKTFFAAGHYIPVEPVNRLLSYRGSSNSDTARFVIGRYCGDTDLSQCSCTIKTENAAGSSDLTVPEVTADDARLYVGWTLSSASAAAAGRLLVQIQFEKIFEDSGRNIVWQSNVMEFEIGDSLDAADEVYDQDPTLFQQWEDRVNAAYAEVSANVQSMQALQSRVQSDAGAVAQRQAGVEQKAEQAAQNAQAAAESAQSAAASASAARAAEEKAQAAQNLAEEYASAAESASAAASVSAQAAQQRVEAAQQAAADAQQKVSAFSGYTREEIDNGFANALIGEKAGQSVTLDDIQPGTCFRSLLLRGQTAETGAGTKRPDNPFALTGAGKITVSGHPSAEYAPPRPLYSLPNGVSDTFDTVAGAGTLKIGKAVLNGSESWSSNPPWDTQAPDYLHAYSYLNDKKPNVMDSLVSTHFPVVYAWGSHLAENRIYSETASNVIYIFIAKAFLPTPDRAGLKAWLAANPVTVLYQLGTPVPSDSAPRQIAAAETVSADRGTLDVRYLCDGNAVLNRVKAAILSLGGQWPQ